MQSPRFVKIKRKASESSSSPAVLKRFKFLASSDTGDDAALRQLIAAKQPSLASFEDDLLIPDLQDFVFDQSSLPCPETKADGTSLSHLL